jgi:exonuclease III
MMLNEILRVLHWNANGFNSFKKTVLTSFLAQHSIDCLLLNENHNQFPNIPDYNKVYHPKSQDLLLYIKNDINFRIVKLEQQKESEIIAIEICDIIIISAYLRNGRKSDGISSLIYFILEMLSLSKKIFIIGDLNAKISYLNNGRQNTAGTFLDNFLSSDNRFILYNNADEMTFRRRHPSAEGDFIESVLDLCIASTDLAPQIGSFEVDSDISLSDHAFLLVTVSVKKSIQAYARAEYLNLYTMRSYNIEKITYPDHFSRTLEDKLYEIAFEPHAATCDLSSFWSNIQKSFYEALKSCKLLKHQGKKKFNFYLSEEVLALKKSNKSNPHVFKSEILKLKRKQWIDFIRGISSEDSLAHVWNKFKISRGLPSSSLKAGDPKREANLIRQLFISYSEPNIHSQEFPGLNLEAKLQFDEPLSSFNGKISTSEFNFALRSVSSTCSSGPDGLPYNIFRQLSTPSKEMIIQFLNEMFNRGEIPENLLHCLQIALPKPTGDYRPISLMNCFLKIYEKILFTRLYTFIDSLLPDSQFGFRKKRSSYDQAANLICALQSARSKNLCVGVIFIDIKKAFDRVDRRSLILDLFKSGVRGKMLRAIYCIINNLKKRVLFNGFVSEEYSTLFGTPQGSILAPLLWNFHFRHLNQNLKYSESFEFADDVALLATAASYEKLFTSLTIDFQNVTNWTHHKGIEISTDKTKFMDFSKTTRKRRINQLDAVRFKIPGQSRVLKLEQVSHYKYLGILLDENLTFKLWTDSIINEIKKRTSMIQRISSTVQLSRDHIETFYLGYVRGFLNYACCIWQMLPKTLVDKIEIEDRRGLRLCVGALLRTPTTELELESKLHNFESLKLRLLLKHGCRLLFSPELRYVYQRIRDQVNTSDLAKKWLEAWSFHELPRSPDIASAMEIVYRITPKRPKIKWKYKGDFWKERLLARFRMGVLPTRSWAQSMKLSHTSFCRHCNETEETIEHLLCCCPHVNRISFENLWNTLSPNVLSWTSLRAYLKNGLSPQREVLEDSLIVFVKQNQLFKKF